MHIKIKVIKQIRLKVQSQRKYFTVATYSKEKKTIMWTSSTRTTEESKRFYLMEVVWNIEAYLLSLLLANRNAAGYFMKLKMLLDHSYL